MRLTINNVVCFISNEHVKHPRVEARFDISMLKVFEKDNFYLTDIYMFFVF